MNIVHHNVDRLDLNLLTVFEAVFREQHLTRAAAGLFLTPSAISHALRRLRDHFDDPLFVRDGKAMRPTPACARMAPDIIEQLTRLRATLQRWGEFNPAENRQTFRIAMPEAAEVMLLPQLTALLNEQAPLVSIVSVRADRRKLASALAGNNLHVAIDIALPIEASVRHRPFLEDRFCVVMAARRGAAADLSVEDYLSADHVAVSTRSVGLVMEDALLLDSGYSRRVAVRCQSYQSAVLISEQSRCLLTMPKTLADAFCHGKNLLMRELPFDFPPLRLNLYWHANSEADPAISWLRQICSTMQSKPPLQH